MYIYIRTRVSSECVHILDPFTNTQESLSAHKISNYSRGVKMPLEFHNRTLCTTIVFYFLLRAQSGKSINARTHSRAADGESSSHKMLPFYLHSRFSSILQLFVSEDGARMSHACIFKRERGFISIYILCVMGANRSLRELLCLFIES
jgi:hypothetical protein